MKNLFIILLLFFVVSCSTGSQIVSSGQVYSGQGKSQLRDKLMSSYPGDDPFITGSFNLYYPETREEIIWGSSRNQFYLFKNVSKPVSCGAFVCKYGNGNLVKWYSSLQSAKNATDKHKSAVASKKNKLNEENKKKEENEIRIAEEKRKKELEEEVKQQEENKKLYSVSSGTGFLVSNKGHIITNNHVTNYCTVITSHYQGEVYESITLASDRLNDLTLLKTNIKSDKLFSVSSQDVSLLDDIYIAGFGFGKNLSSSVKVTRGVVSALTGLKDNYSRFQVDAALQPGNSGGPIVDMKGNVVGIAVEKANFVYTLENFQSLPENMNFGIKSSVLNSFVRANGINISNQTNVEMSKKDLGNLITDATIYIDCLMTEARYEEVQSLNQKVLYKKIK